MTRTLQIAALLLSATAAAQAQYVVPPGVERMWGSSPGSGTGIAAFFSSRVQYLNRAPLPIGQTISQIGFRGRPNTQDVGAYTVDGEIWMSSTVVPPGFMSTTFASNRGSNHVVVVPRQTLNVVAQPATRSLAAWIPYPLSTPFVFGTNGGSHLLVEVAVYSTTSSALLLDRCFANPNGSAAEFGRGCGNATIEISGTPNPGTSFDLVIAGAVPGRPAWLIGGLDALTLGGIVPLPLDLGLVLGMNGCNLLVDPMLPSFARVTDGLGAASLRLSVPANTSPLKLAFQWLYQDPSAPNPLMLRTTDAEVVHIGPRTCPDSQYLFSTNPGAASGFLADAGVAMRILAQ